MGEAAIPLGNLSFRQSVDYQKSVTWLLFEYDVNPDVWQHAATFVTETGTVADLQIRRNYSSGVDAVQWRLLFNGSSAASGTFVSAHDLSTFGSPEYLIVAVGLHNRPSTALGAYVEWSIAGTALTPNRCLGNLSGTTNASHQIRERPEVNFPSQLASLMLGTVGGTSSFTATPPLPGRLLGAYYMPNAGAVDYSQVHGEFCTTTITPGTEPTPTPQDPELPEVDPNEVPELAPAIPVPWPDGWDLPDWDETPSTSTIPRDDPRPRPTLADPPPGESTDTGLATRIMDGFGWLGDRIEDSFSWLVDNLWTMVEWLVERLKELLFQLIEALALIARWIVGELIILFEWLARQIVGALARIAEILIQGFQALLGFLASILSAIANGFLALGGLIATWATWIGDIIGQWVTWLGTYLSGLLTTLMNFLNGLAEWMVTQLQAITVSVSIALDLVVDVFLDLAIELFVPTWTWSEVLPTPPPPPPEPLPPGIPESWGAQCGPSFAIPVVNLTLRTPNPPDSGCPGHGPGGARTTADDLQGSVWGYRNALRALLAFSLWLSVGFVGLRAMPWSRSRDDASDTFVAAGGGL